MEPLTDEQIERVYEIGKDHIWTALLTGFVLGAILGASIVVTSPRLMLEIIWGYHPQYDVRLMEAQHEAE